MIRLLYAGRVDKDIDMLSEAWSDPATFVFLSGQSGVSRKWIEEAVDIFPDRFKIDHFVLLSSGSTGQPKLIVASRKRAENLVKVIHDLQEGELAKETVLALPLTYCYAFVNQWLWARIFDKKLIYTFGFSRPDLLKDALSGSNMAMLCLVASQIPLLERNFGEDISFPGIIRLNFAGAPFPQNDMHKVHSFFPNAKIFNNYGCAEAMPRLTIRSEEISEDGSNIGKVLPGVEMKTDEEGKILFKSPYSAVGFYDNGKFMSLTEDMWISSGDFGSELEKGYWSVKGRTNEVFKRFGEKISIPQLLKSVFSKWGGSAVFYSESDSGGERGHVLVVSPRPNEKQLRDVLSVFRSGYSRAHWPIRLESVDSFPLLENGKVDRVSLMDSNDRVTHWYQRI